MATVRLPAPMAQFGSRDRKAVNQAIRMFTDSRLAGMRVERYSWWVHWRELADYILPRRYKWLITPNQANRGSPINGHILDSTGTLAARTLASGMLSGVTSPTRPWFKLKIGNFDSTQTSPVSLWLAECERRMQRIFAESNFYTAMAVLYFDLVVFGTAALIIYEDRERIIHCINPCLGEFYIGVDSNNRPTALYREFVMTIDAVVKKWGEDNVTPDVLVLYRQGGAQLSKEIVIAHAIEPNDDGRDFGIAKHFKFREIYWEVGKSQEYILSKSGFNEAPHISVRWDLVSNDAYGRSPGMDALGDIKQLQQEVKRKAQAIDKLVNPPMVADVQLKNQPASLLPGGITYVAGLRNEAPGFRPVYQVSPPVKEIMEDLNEVRERIKVTFHNDLFQMISQLETVRTATEIDARREEKLVLLGPVLERIQEEGLNNIIERVFSICLRAGVLPDAPAELGGAPINVEYVSMLAEAQRAVSTSGIERLLQLSGNLAGVDPAVLDNIDIDFALDEYADLLAVNPRLIRSPEQLAAIRQKRDQQQQQEKLLQMTDAATKGAGVLAKTQVSGGGSALGQMLENQGAI